MVTLPTSSPISRLPPSPMKIRDGVARFQGRNAAQAPARAKHSGAAAAAPEISASTPAPTAETTATAAATPSMLSIMLKADQATARVGKDGALRQPPPR